MKLRSSNPMFLNSKYIESYEIYIKSKQLVIKTIGGNVYNLSIILEENETIEDVINEISAWFNNETIIKVGI